MKILLIFCLFLSLIACKEVQNTENFHFVYLNWASPDTSSTMQVNVATSRDHKNWQIHYRQSGDDNFEVVDLEVNSNEYLKGAFHLHHELTGLDAEKQYEFFIKADDQEGSIYSFATIAKDKKGLKFLVGGDTGTGSRFQNMAKVAKETEFDLAVFGGDIAYADGEIKNYKRWIKWLDIWTDASTKGNKLIPFIVAVGNHETNYLYYFGTRFQRAPFFYSLFHQDYNSYFIREVAGNQFLILDTGHLTSYKSQNGFIKGHLDPSFEGFQFAFYHIPFFPGHRDFKGQASKGREAWMSLFEEGGLDVAFEHHDHVLKRTYPLKNLNVNPEEGIVYLGDGAMGKSTRELNNEWYLERSAEENHFWLVELNSNYADYSAIGDQSQVLDSFRRNLK